MTIEQKDALPGILARRQVLSASAMVAGSAAANSTDGALAAALDLFADLNQAGIRYCKWKGNIRLAEALYGHTDVDMLVDPDHAESFKAILRRHDIKQAFAAPGKRHPDTEDYLGFDPATGRLFHLHVYYRLILGDRFVDNYCLPLEKAFLDSAYVESGIKIPAPDLELVVYSLRCLLKYRDRDALKDALNIRRPGLPRESLVEVNYLQAQVSPALLSDTLAEHADVLPSTTIEAFLRTVAQAPRDGRRLFELRRQVHRALRPYQQKSRLRASLAYYGELWQRRKRFRLSQPWQKKVMAGGGITIALIGADGSGKSTMSKILHQWLSWKLSTRRYYLGSKEPSRRSRGLYMLFRMARRSHRAVRARFGQGSFFERAFAKTRSWLFDLHSLSLGQDRRRRSQAGQRAAAAGAIVLYDRFPLLVPLDGPRIGLTENGRADALQRKLARIEDGVYKDIVSPDHFLVLQVSPGVSLARKPEHQPQAIQAKCRAIDQFVVGEFSERSRVSSVMVVDAGQPFEQVELALKRIVWSLL